MALDKILIGARIRELREQIIGESREEFAQRCDLGTDRYVGQLERGEFYPSKCFIKLHMPQVLV